MFHQKSRSFTLNDLTSNHTRLVYEISFHYMQEIHEKFGLLGKSSGHPRKRFLLILEVGISPLTDIYLEWQCIDDNIQWPNV